MTWSGVKKEVLTKAGVEVMIDEQISKAIQVKSVNERLLAA